MRSRPRRPRRGTTPGPNHAAVLLLDQLEAREVPSVTVVDLTTAGASGAVGGVTFTQALTRPAGTGVLDSFVRIQALGNATVEAGYNTSARPLAYNENSSPQFTRTLRMDDVPLVPTAGVNYREFVLDINQKASAPLLSLDELRVFVSSSPNLSGRLAADGSLPGATLVFNLDAGGDHMIRLNANLSTGSGAGDMIMRVPETTFQSALAGLFGGPQYLYLYSKFGATKGATANGGFEEWAVQGPGGGPVLAPVATTTVSGYVFLTTSTGQTVYDPTDTHQTALGGVTVSLYIDGALYTTTQTNRDGSYSFDDVPIPDGADVYVVASYGSDTNTVDSTFDGSPVQLDIPFYLS